MTGPSGSDPRSRRWVHPSELPADSDSSGGEGAERGGARAQGRWTVPAAAGIAGAVAAFGLATVVLRARDAGDGAVPTSVAAVLQPRGLGDASEAVAEVANSAAPALVAVTAWDGAVPHHGSGIAYPASDAGRGGRTLVVTSASLVEGVDGIELSDAAGRTAPATLLGTDRDYDLALLETELGDLPALDFPSAASAAEVGDECVAVGAGHDQEGPWASRGVVAAVGKVVSVDGRWMVDALEVDTRVAPAGVGGAVLDGSGTLLGVLTDFGGDGDHILVVPSATARRSVEQLLEDGTVEHPWLGLAMADTASPARGALVDAVDPRGPAARAGVLAGDVVIKIGARTVRGMTAAMREVRRHPVGAAVVLRVVRGAEELDLTVVLEPRPGP